MRILSTGLMVVALAGLGACAGNTSRPTDVGSMALPSTGTQGVRVTEPVGRDVGSMSAPSGSGGGITTTVPAGRDVGSMTAPSGSGGGVTRPVRPSGY